MQISNRSLLAKLLVSDSDTSFTKTPWFQKRMERLTGMYCGQAEFGGAQVQLLTGKVVCSSAHVRGKPGKPPKKACDPKLDEKHQAFLGQWDRNRADRLQRAIKKVAEQPVLFPSSGEFWSKVAEQPETPDTGKACEDLWIKMNPSAYRESVWVENLSRELCLHERHAWQLAKLLESEVVTSDHWATRDGPSKINLFRAIPPSTEDLVACVKKPELDWSSLQSHDDAFDFYMCERLDILRCATVWLMIDAQTKGPPKDMVEKIAVATTGILTKLAEQAGDFDGSNFSDDFRRFIGVKEERQSISKMYEDRIPAQAQSVLHPLRWVAGRRVQVHKQKDEEQLLLLQLLLRASEFQAIDAGWETLQMLVHLFEVSNLEHLDPDRLQLATLVRSCLLLQWFELAGANDDIKSCREGVASQPIPAAGVDRLLTDVFDRCLGANSSGVPRKEQLVVNAVANFAWMKHCLLHMFRWQAFLEEVQKKILDLEKEIREEPASDSASSVKEGFNVGSNREEGKREAELKQDKGWVALKKSADSLTVLVESEQGPIKSKMIEIEQEFKSSADSSSQKNMMLRKKLEQYVQDRTEEWKTFFENSFQMKNSYEEQGEFKVLQYLARISNHSDALVDCLFHKDVLWRHILGWTQFSRLSKDILTENFYTAIPNVLRQHTSSAAVQYKKRDANAEGFVLDSRQDDTYPHYWDVRCKFGGCPRCSSALAALSFREVGLKILRQRRLGGSEAPLAADQELAELLEGIQDAKKPLCKDLLADLLASIAATADTAPISIHQFLLSFHLPTARGLEVESQIPIPIFIIRCTLSAFLQMRSASAPGSQIYDLQWLRTLVAVYGTGHDFGPGRSGWSDFLHAVGRSPDWHTIHQQTL